MVVRLSDAQRTRQAETLGVGLDAGTGPGKIRFYTGGQPATPATAPSGTLLAEYPLNDPATSAAAVGVETILDPAQVTPTATGVVGWARFLDSDNNVVLDCNVTATGGGGDLTCSSVNWDTGTPVDFAAMTYTVPMS